MNTEKNVAQAGAEEESAPVYSYHTFIFPFLWGVSLDGSTVKRSNFEKCLHPRWCRSKASDDTWSDTELYSQYCYFNQAARNAIYDTLGNHPEEIVHNYLFNLSSGEAKDAKEGIELEHKRQKGAESKAEFTISCTVNDIIKQYILKLNGIRMKLYNTGIGLLIFELENYTYTSLDDINKINEYGRRLYMPYVSCGMCADSITVSSSEIKSFNITSKIRDDKVQNIKLPSFITELLSNGKYSVSTETANENTYYIEPVIGDRMYVCCIYQNTDIVNRLSHWNGENYAYLSDALHQSPSEDANNCAVDLYKFVFVDGNSFSCPNREMLHASLSEHIYARWIEWGTVHGITEYSTMCVTSGISVPSVGPPFLIDYTEMVYLALAQRASLLVFERRLSDSALKKVDIKEVQNDYIMFQSQLLLQEVTPEQQGIELYNELVESMYIEKQSQQIENQISGLFDLKNYKNDSIESTVLYLLALLGITETVNSIGDWINLSPFDIVFPLRTFIAVAVGVAGSAAYWIFKHKK